MTIRRRRRAREAGFSLIEVLVSIALLIVGIVSIIELFPPGFFALNAISTRQAATSAANNALSRTNAALSNINLIYSQFDAFNDQAVFTNTVGDSNNTAASGYNNVGPNAQRVVSGETFSIPALNSGGKSVYAVTFGPIYMPTADQPASHITVRGAPWAVIQGTAYGSNITTDSAGVPPPGTMDPSDVLTPGQPQCLVDYANARIALPLERCYADFNSAVRTANPTPSTAPASYAETLTASVVGTDGSGATHKYTATLTYDPTSAALVAPSNIIVSGAPDSLYHSLWFDPTAIGTWSYTDSAGASIAGTPGLPWIVNTFTIKRDYILNSPLVSSTWTYNGSPTQYYDPYQYSVSPNISSTSDVNLGVLFFPASTASLRDATGKPVTATADYTVADWHILAEDHAATSDSIRLNAPSILEFGDPLDQGDAGGSYKGIVDARSGMVNAGYTDTRDIYVLNLETGKDLRTTAVPVDPNADSASTTYPDPQYTVNYGAARVTLGTGYAKSNARLRIYYRARHQWSINITKASGFYQYSGVYPQGSNTYPYPAFTADYNSLGRFWVSSDVAPGTILYFPKTDIGKTVNIGALTIATGVTTLPYRRIDHAGAWTVLASDGTTNTSVGYIDLRGSRTPDGNPAGFLGSGETLATSTGYVPASNVVGGSLVVRTSYFEQNSLRHQDTTSYLFPGQ